MRIRFVHQLPPGSSQTEIELTRSDARKHAMQVVARRKKAKKLRQKLACSVCGGPCSEACQHMVPAGVGKGNSDPFDSRAVAVTPRVNEVIYFYQKFILPSSYKQGSPVGAMVKQLLGQVQPVDIVLSQDMLDDNCCATTFLSAFLTLMNRSSGAFDKEVELLRGKSLTVLRSRIGTMTAETAPIIAKSTMMLYLGAVFAEDEVAQEVHGKGLSLIMFPTRVQAIVALAFLGHAAWLDAQSISAMRRLPGSKDPRARPKRAESGFRVANEELGSSVLPPLDESISAEPLRGLVVRIRRDWVRQYRPTHLGSERWPEPNSSPTKAVHDEDESPDNPDLSINKNDQHETNQTVLTMTIIKYVALVGLTSTFGIKQVGPKIVDRMRSTVEESWMSASRNVLLFSCFIGAVIEIRDKDGEWFCSKLAELAAGMTWTSVKEVTDRFLPTDAVEPNGALWVEEVIRTGTRPDMG